MSYEDRARIEYEEMTFYTRFQKIPQVDCMACIARAEKQST